MKSIHILIVIITSVFFHSCSDNENPEDSQSSVRFADTTYTSVLEQAKTENKKVFMKFEASWCGTCKKFNKMVMTDSVVGDYYNKNFINYNVDIDTDKELTEKFEITATPTFVYTDQNGKILLKTSGYKGAEELINIGRNINK